MGSVILGTGAYVPERVLSNFDLENMVETSDEWITTRTGIKTRHIAGVGENTSNIAAKAAEDALRNAGLAAADLDLIIVATITCETGMPSCACLVQKELEASNAFAFDINAACSGFIYALDLADKYISNNPDMTVMVIGAETLSSRTNWQDRNTCVLFGDGAGACILTGGGAERGILGSKLFSDGSLWHLLSMESASSRNPNIGPGAITDKNADFAEFGYPRNGEGAYIKMAGREVFKHAVRAMEDSIGHVLRSENITSEELKLVIPHQANIRILKSLVDRLDVDSEKVFINVYKYGNTSAASIPLALNEANSEGRLQEGDLLLLCAFGGGFTWGAMLMRW